MARLRFSLAMLIFGTIGIFVRYIPLPSAAIALARGVIGTLFLAGAAFLSRRRFDWPALRRNLPLLAGCGAAIGLNWIFLFEAYRYTTVAVATLCYYMAPVFVLLLSPLVLGERLSVRKLVCIAAALAGMVLISGVGSGSGAGPGSAAGIGLGLAAAVLYAGVMLANKFVRGVSGYEATVLQLGFAAAVLAPYTLAVQRPSLAGLTLAGAALLAVVGIVHTGIAYWLYFGSLPQLSAQTAALYSYIDPAFAIVLSALLLREPLGAAGAAGAVLILGSTLAAGREH